MIKLGTNIKNNLLAPCGLYCGVCGIFYAYKNNDSKLKEKLAKAYWTKPELIECEGCLSNKRFNFCDVCDIRKCCADKKLAGCYQCDEFPCNKIKNYPYPLATKYMINSTQVRRELGDLEWIKWEENNWKCKKCGEINFRGAKFCHKCNEKLDYAL